MKRVCQAIIDLRVVCHVIDGILSVANTVHISTRNLVVYRVAGVNGFAMSARA
jgi:hypothetical protein